MFRRMTVFALLMVAGITEGHAQIVALGASSTAGYGVGTEAAFPTLVAQILRARGRPMTVRNAGISGDTTGGMLARLSSAVPEGTKIVILQIAGNDMLKHMSPVAAAANRCCLPGRNAFLWRHAGRAGIAGRRDRRKRACARRTVRQACGRPGGTARYALSQRLVAVADDDGRESQVEARRRPADHR